MTFSPASLFAAATSPSIPPRAAADVAVLASPPPAGADDAALGAAALAGAEEPADAAAEPAGALADADAAGADAAGALLGGLEAGVLLEPQAVATRAKAARLATTPVRRNPGVWNEPPCLIERLCLKPRWVFGTRTSSSSRTMGTCGAWRPKMTTAPCTGIRPVNCCRT